jgi:hypothetical protein
MSKHSIFLLLSIALLATACARFKKASEPTIALVSIHTPTTAAAAPIETATQSPAANPPPDFSTMTFIEKNNLYLQLLSDRQAEGGDTTVAEEAYARSLDAAMEGNASEADQYLQQAILLLWK